MTALVYVNVWVTCSCNKYIFICVGVFLHLKSELIFKTRFIFVQFMLFSLPVIKKDLETFSNRFNECKPNNSALSFHCFLHYLIFTATQNEWLSSTEQIKDSMKLSGTYAWAAPARDNTATSER